MTISGDSDFVIGIDGGQTSTRCALLTLDGRVLGEGAGGGLIHLAAEDGERRFVAALNAAIAGAWAAAGLAARPLRAIGLGLTGVEADGAEAPLARRLVMATVTAEHVIVENDGVAALVGAHLDGPGIIIVAGTGMIALGKDPSGRVERVGGWGWLLGDEGSAATIGRQGLIAALHAFDGAASPTTLLPLVLAHFSVRRPRDIKGIVFAPGFGARDFAALAPVVSRAAAEGDPTARAILHAAGRDLAREVLALSTRLDFHSAPVPIAPIGGVFEHIWGVRAAFTTAIADHLPTAHVRDPLLPPVLGAALMALCACGVAPNEVGSTLRAGAASLGATPTHSSPSLD